MPQQRAVRSRYESGSPWPARGTWRARLEDDFVTAQAKRRQDHIEQPSARRRKRAPANSPSIGRSEPGNCVGMQGASLYPPAMLSTPYIGPVTMPDPLLVFDRTTLRLRGGGAPRARWGTRLSSSARSPAVSSSASAVCRRTFPLALDVGCHGDEIGAALGDSMQPRRHRSCAADLGTGFARTAQGPALVVADEEALPFARRSLRPRR